MHAISNQNGEHRIRVLMVEDDEDDAVLISSALRDAETIQRVYIITGEDRYRSMYPGATQSVDGRIRRLRKLVEDNPWQQDNVDRLEATIQGRLETASQTIAVRRDKGFDAARATITSLHSTPPAGRRGGYPAGDVSRRRSRS